MESIASGPCENPRDADRNAHHPRSGTAPHPLISTDSPSKFQKTEGCADSSREPTGGRTCDAPNPPGAEPAGGYAWEPYVSTWRVSDKLNCPPLAFEPESFDEFDAVDESVRRYQVLYDQIATAELSHPRIVDALKICAIAQASLPSEKNCISLATKALLFLRSEVLRAHESGAYVYGKGAWTAIGSDLPHGMVEGVLNAFKFAEGLLLRGPESWEEFARFCGDGVDVQEDACPDESEYTRRPTKWNVAKAKFLRDMRTTS